MERRRQGYLSSGFRFCYLSSNSTGIDDRKYILNALKITSILILLALNAHSQNLTGEWIERHGSVLTTEFHLFYDIVFFSDSFHLFSVNYHDAASPERPYHYWEDSIVGTYILSNDTLNLSGTIIERYINMSILNDSTSRQKENIPFSQKMYCEFKGDSLFLNEVFFQHKLARIPPAAIKKPMQIPTARTTKCSRPADKIINLKGHLVRPPCIRMIGLMNIYMVPGSPIIKRN
jgi:hypothetical protein